MKLPHTYKGYTIVAEKSRASDRWWLRIQFDGRTVKSYRPPLQVIYLGGPGDLAYDHDVQECEQIIDRIEKRLRDDRS